MTANRFGRVAVLMGGKSAEREVSLNSGKAVLAALQGAGVDAVAFDPAEQPLITLASGDYDRAFIVLHGRGGEDGSIQGFLQHIGLPYTGSDVQGSALCLDKVKCKHIFASANLPTARYRVARQRDYQSDMAADWLSELGGKVMVKPTNEGSSVGMTIADSGAALDKAINHAFDYDQNVLIEEYLSGDEYTVSILGDKVLPVIRMRTPREFYDYDAKYKSNSTEYLCPAPLTTEQTAELQQLADDAFQLLGASGWGRVDAMQDANGEFKLLEVNTVPGMTATSLVPMAAKEAGMDFSALVTAILAQTLDT